MRFTSCRVQKRKDREGFQGVLSYKEDGKNKELRKRLKATTTKAAKQELEEWRQEEEKKALNTKLKVQEVPLFFDYAEEVIAYHETVRDVSAARLYDYRIVYRKLQRDFENKPLNQYSQRDIENLYAKIKKSGGSDHVLLRIHYVLKKVFDKAEIEELIEKNPMRHMKAPKPKKKKPGINSLTEDGVKDFLTVFNTPPLNRVKMAALIALYTGMRRGEVCGLRWIDVDLKKQAFHVQHATGMDYETTNWQLKDTKTSKNRDIAIPDALVEKLKEWKDIQGEEPYVIGENGTFASPEYLGKRYSAMIEALDIRGIEGRLLTFHDLRHTYATITIAQGADVVSVASQLGHADVSMTLNTYASVLPQAKKQVASIMDNLMK